eukprot:CAMPEP_0170399354 /NCGR_PEP_ID=MMETSP0117_2-20130122/23915_1 /TAXON_ID=400756 /ORGANISM="Durinskia baltica, Strain CSIRO CS-38" /LENGTH=258 /DNA_ID=CAMNT_0010656021 /DNA_START=53 /DNA_END=826 /DNA_ORIENTATION=+
MEAAVVLPRRRSKESLRRELNDTLKEKTAFEQRMRQLRAEIELCKASREALELKERWLRKECEASHAGDAVDSNPDVDSVALDSVAAGATDFPDAAGPLMRDAAGTVFFTLDESDPPEGADRDFRGEEEADALDYLGVARCRQCGLRLPLDVASIENHTKRCFVGDDIEDIDCSNDIEGEEQSPKMGRDEASAAARWRPDSGACGPVAVRRKARACRIEVPPRRREFKRLRHGVLAPAAWLASALLRRWHCLMAFRCP